MKRVDVQEVTFSTKRWVRSGLMEVYTTDPPIPTGRGWYREVTIPSSKYTPHQGVGEMNRRKKSG